MSHYAIKMLSLLKKKKKAFLHILCIPRFSWGHSHSQLRTHNVSDKALLNACLPSLTCWDKFHITSSTPGENVIRGLERLHTNKRSVSLSLGRHKASVWKWVRFFRPGLNGKKHYPFTHRVEREQSAMTFTTAQPWLYNASSKPHRKRLSLMEVHFAVYVL